MRKLASLLVVAGLALGGTVAAAAPGAASTTAGKPSKFCRALSKFDSTGLGNPTSEKEAGKYVKQLKKLEKAAKGKTKSAIGELVDSYEAIAEGDDYKDVYTDGDFIEASITFGVAAVNCGLEQIPDITLPDDIDLPDITLPDIDLPN